MNFPYSRVYIYCIYMYILLILPNILICTSVYAAHINPCNDNNIEACQVTHSKRVESRSFHYMLKLECFESRFLMKLKSVESRILSVSMHTFRFHRISISSHVEIGMCRVTHSKRVDARILSVSMHTFQFHRISISSHVEIGMCRVTHSNEIEM